MAVVAIKSIPVTNADALPIVQNAAFVEYGRQRSSAAYAAVANGDSIASTYRLLRLKSNWRIQSLRVHWTAITSGAMNLGLYRTTNDGGAAVSAACYASAQSIASATAAGTELMFAVRALTAIANQVWQDAGLSANSGVDYDLVATLTAAAAAAGTIAVDLSYVLD